MRIVAFILGLLGIVNLIALPNMFHAAGAWILSLLTCIGSLLLILIAIGILARWKFAWPLGFIAIAQGGICFFLNVALTHRASDDQIVLILCGLGGVAVSTYWSVVWYRQKKWFYDDPMA